MKKIVVVSIMSRDYSENFCNQRKNKSTYAVITIWTYLR
jgi:hypothetical protein